MLTAFAQASAAFFGSEHSICRHRGGLQRRAWFQEVRLYGGGAKPAWGRGQVGCPAGRAGAGSVSRRRSSAVFLAARRLTLYDVLAVPARLTPATQLRDHVQAGEARARGDYGVPGDVGA